MVFWPFSLVFCDPRYHKIKIFLFLDVIQLKTLAKNQLGHGTVGKPDFSSLLYVKIIMIGPFPSYRSQFQ